MVCLNAASDPQGWEASFAVAVPAGMLVVKTRQAGRTGILPVSLFRDFRDRLEACPTLGGNSLIPDP